MFSSLRNYSKNIMESERFYYDDYDYYNIYQDLKQDYKNDLSKFIFNTNRKSTPTIVTYASPKLQKLQHLRNIKGQKKDKAMEDFLNSFLNIFMENNYCVPSSSYQKDPKFKNFELLHFSAINDKKYDKESYPLKMMAKEALTNLFSQLKDISINKQKVLQQKYVQFHQKSPQEIPSIQFNYGIELYTQKILAQNYTNPKSQEFELYYDFVVEIHHLMFDILCCKIRTLLLMSQPKTEYLNFLVHPLLIPLMSFLKLDLKIQKPNNLDRLQFIQMKKLVDINEKPKIVFINFDGRESAHNLRAISAINSQILYISFYNEPSWIQKEETSMIHLFQSTDENFTFSYKKLWEIYSQSIIQQYRYCDSQRYTTKILLFPLNSSYVVKKYFQYKLLHTPHMDFKIWSQLNHPKLDESSHIYELFQHVVFPQIEIFKGNMIFISYNGQLDIKEEQFTNVVKMCSILSDHRVILYTNFTHLFQQEELQVNEQDDQSDKIMCAHEFFQKYFEYNLENINEERLYQNISMFLKYGPGIYQPGERIFANEASKLTMWKFYYYIQSLPCVQKFSWLQKYQIRKWTSLQWKNLCQKYYQTQISHNKQQIKYYDNLISIVIAQFMCKNIDQEKLQVIIGKKLYYKLKLIQRQLHNEWNQLCSVFEQFQEEEISLSEKQTLSREIADSLMQNYFNNAKMKLIVEILQTQRHNKYFYLTDSEKPLGYVSCFQFTLDTGNDEKQVYLEKYSQVIVFDDVQHVFIVNYKRDDNIHIFLHGTFSGVQISHITVSEMQSKQKELVEEVKDYFECHELAEEGLLYQKQDILFVQYNYTIHNQKLYLYWPLLWNLKEEARHKLLGLQYKAKRVFKMVKIFRDKKLNTFKYENVPYQPKNDGIQIFPRWGCTAKSLTQDSFIIFGGIFDNINDFTMVGTGMCQVFLARQGQYETFTMAGTPKRNNCLKPKINYKFETEIKEEEVLIKLYGGYGRQGTSFHNLFAYEKYYLDQNNKIYKQIQNKVTRRVVNIEKPLQISKIGKFNIITNNSNYFQTEQNFSDKPKDKFVFERPKTKTIKSQSNQQQWEVMSFIDDTYRIKQYDINLKKQFLWSYCCKVNQKIYLKCWNPQMYVIDGSMKEFRINLSIVPQKKYLTEKKMYQIPKEQDIVSLCLENDKLYIICKVPTTLSYDQGAENLKHYSIYESILSNINKIIERKEIQMEVVYTFTGKTLKFIEMKSMFFHKGKIYLVGGLCQSRADLMHWKFIREDYILQPNRDTFDIRTKIIQVEYINFDMPNSVVVKTSQHYYIYSVVYESSHSPSFQEQIEEDEEMDAEEGIEQKESDSQEEKQWRVKIEKHRFQNNEGSLIKTNSLRTYVFNKKTQKIQKYRHLSEPKFVKIVPYTRFNIQILREMILKLLQKIKDVDFIENKYKDIIEKLHKEKDDKSLQIQLEKEVKVFEDLINTLRIKPEMDAQLNEQQQMLLKLLRHAYYLTAKMMLEKCLYLKKSDYGQYIFIIEDKANNKVKYIAVGLLNSTQLNFFRIRFKQQLLIILNEFQDDNLFYHPLVSGFYKFEDESMEKGDTTEYKNKQNIQAIRVSNKIY